MKFCTVICCMDGRIQRPINEYLRKRFKAEYVDTITEAGPIMLLSEQKNMPAIDLILDRLNISIEIHKSVGLAISGHYDCARNPAEKDVQINQIKDSIKFIKKYYPDIEIIGLWVDKNWSVVEQK